MALCGLLLEDALAAEPTQTVLGFDAGTVYPRTIIEHAFRIQHSGGPVWQFGTPSVGCSCSVPEVPRPFLRPGEQMDLPLRWHVGAERNIAVRALVSVPVTAGEKSWSMDLSATATVAAPLDLPPQGVVLRMGPYRRSDLPQTVERLMARGGHPAPFDSVSILASPEGLFNGIMHAPTAKDPDHWRLAVTMAPCTIIGALPFRIEIEFLNGAETLPYREILTGVARISGSCTARPAALLFGAAEAGTTLTRSFRLLPQAGMDAIQVASLVSSDAATFLVNATDAETIAVTFCSAGDQRSVSGWVDVELTNEEILRVPCIAAVTNPR